MFGTMFKLEPTPIKKAAVRYKKIKLPLSKPLSKRNQEAISAFNDFFAADDILIKPNGKHLQIALRQVDFASLEKFANDLNDGKTILAEVCEAVKSIGSYGMKSGKRSYVDFANERKVKGRAAKEKRRGKYFYASDHEYQTIENAVPAKFVDTFICGDSENLLKRLPDNCVDLVFTSPPYNFGLDYQQSPDDQHWPTYFDKLFQVFDECIRVLKFGGRIIVNIQPLYSDYIPSHHLISKHFIDRKLIWKGEILWEKNNYNCKYTAWGSWKSPSNPYLKYSWEFIEIFCKGDLKKTGHRDNADIMADEFKKWVYGKWSIAPERKMREYGHPAMFPEALAMRVIKLFSFQGDFVLDPFAGVGTTCVVAKQTNRKYLGLDISKEYCDMAIKRLDSILT